jgi:hypothetical protein
LSTIDPLKNSGICLSADTAGSNSFAVIQQILHSNHITRSTKLCLALFSRADKSCVTQDLSLLKCVFAKFCSCLIFICHLYQTKYHSTPKLRNVFYLVGDADAWYVADILLNPFSTVQTTLLFPLVEYVIKVQQALPSLVKTSFTYTEHSSNTVHTAKIYVT